MATARWLSRWLLRHDDAIEESDFPVEAGAELRCTHTGQVLTDFKDVSVFDLNRQRAAALMAARERTSAGQSNDAFQNQIKKRLGLPDGAVAAVRPRVADPRSPRTLTFEVEPELVLPALELSVDSRPNGPDMTIIKLGVDWNKQRATAKAPALAGSSERVICFDPRGMGKTAPKSDAGRSLSPFGADWKDAYIALAIGRPLLGQRVADLLAVLEGLKLESGEKEHRGFHVVGVGAAGAVVLHAALLDRHGLIKKITLERSLVSWADIVERGLSRDQMGSVVPGVLEVYDLPDLAARLAPLPLTIEQPVDAMGVPVSQSMLERSYRQCKQAYGTTGPLVLHAETKSQ